jgi:hypothetical protein
MRKICKKATSLVLVFAMSMMVCVPAFAADKGSSKNVIELRCNSLSSCKISSEDQVFLNKVVSVGEYFSFDESTNKLFMSLSKEQLIKEYGFSLEEYNRLERDIIGKQFNSVTPPIATDVYIDNGTLYISYVDLAGGVASALYTAASVGPAALAAALGALSTSVSGPVGAVITAIVTVASLPSLTELCGRIIYAVATQQGIYIRPILSYPPLEIGYWEG